MKQEKHFMVDILFVLALFGLFTVSALMLVTIGSEVYRHTVDDMNTNWETRTAVSYITEKIRQNDNMIADTQAYTTKNISVSTFYERPVLILTQVIDDETYHTYLYMHEGYLKELFVKSDSYIGENMLSAGQNIVELFAFGTEQISDNLIYIKIITQTGQLQEFYVSTHCTPE